MEIKTIDLQAKQWFDKTNANSYFSAIITLNFGLDSEKTIGMPFQYGYDNQYRYQALNELQNYGYIPYTKVYTLVDYCLDNKIDLRMSKKENCLKSEVKNFIKYI